MFNAKYVFALAIAGALGVIVWTLLSSLITDSCTIFIAAESIIKQVNLPFGVHVARMVWRNVMVSAAESNPISCVPGILPARFEAVSIFRL